MGRRRWLLVLFVAVVLALSFAVPSEDVPETSYDESASLPYTASRVVSSAVPEPVAKASVISNEVPESVAEALAASPRAPSFRLGSMKRFGTQQLDRRTGWAYPVCDSLTILDHSLRC